MFSHQVIWWPHRGQRERGLTTDRSFGHLATHTLRKEPKMAPSTKAETPDKTETPAAEP
jgi:hypothetical protein